MLKLTQYAHGSYGLVADNKLYVFDGGRSPLIPAYYRHYLGFTTIEALILTHYDNHHIENQPTIVNYFNGQVKHWYTSGMLAPPSFELETAKTAEMQALVERYGIDCQYLLAGTQIHSGRAQLYVVNPFAETIGRQPGTVHQNPNDWNNLVILAVYGGFRLLMTGDLHVFWGDEWTEEEIWYDFIGPAIRRILGDTKIHVLQIPHHGDSRYAQHTWMNYFCPDLVLMDNGLGFTAAMAAFCDENGYDYYSLRGTETSGTRLVQSGYLELDAYPDGTYSLEDFDPSVWSESVS